MLQYLYKSKTRYGIVHVDLGPLFMVSRLHLQMLWQDLMRIAEADGSRQAIIERASRFRDLRTSVAAGQGDLLCGLDAEGLRAAFCLYNAACDDHFAEFAAVATPLGCSVQHFSGIDEAIAWVGMAKTEATQDARDAGPVVPLTNGLAASHHAPVLRTGFGRLRRQGRQA